MVILVSVETVVLSLMALLVCGLLRSHAEIIRAVQTYGRALGNEAGVALPGELAPRATEVTPSYGFAGETLDGRPVEYPLWATDDRDTVLAFLTTGCQMCHVFWEAFQRDDLGLPADTRVVVVTKDKRSESRGRLRKLAHLVPDQHEVVMSREAWTTYGVPGSPYFVYINGATATLAGQGTAMSWPQVLDLLNVTREEDELAAEERAAGVGDRELADQTSDGRSEVLQS